jgi:Ca2+/Na+ antiporter
MDGGAWASVMGLVIFNVLCLIEVAIDYGIHPFRASYIRPLVISLSVLTVLILLIHSRISDLALPLLFFVFAGFVVISIAVSKSVEETDLLMIDIAENVAHRKFDRLRRIVIRLMYNSDKGHLQAN